AKTTSVRERNMQKRRMRILNEARRLLSDGFEALNVRELAHQAGVTVPTIYNLIGKKEDVLLALVDDVLNEIETRVYHSHEDEPLKMATNVVTESAKLFAEDENYYRSAFIAVEGLDQSGLHHAAVERVYAWAATMMKRGVDTCREAGLLRGKISSSDMSALMIRNYRISCRSWAFGHATIEEFCDQVVGDIYLILAADAVETFHAQLIRKLKKRHSSRSSNKRKRVTP
ncbi:MAG: TetR/AcrR family transcriptional regulator, partial [Pseudomonadota bacterium]